VLPAGTGLAEAAAVLRAGGLVAFPTETVYGLGADARDATAVAGIFRAKRRPDFDPLIVHLAAVGDAHRLTALPPPAAALAERFWPGPLTLVLARPDTIPRIVTSGLDTVAVRVPDHPVARELIARAGVPVAAPSANRFGRLSPTRAAHVVADLDGEVDVVLDGGPTRWGVESTVVDARGGRPLVLRLGALAVEDLAAAGPVEVRRRADGRPVTPGALPSHYAPGAPLRLLGGDHPSAAERRIRACLAFRALPPGYAAGEVLSPTGDLVAAAARLFDALHRLDAATRDQELVEIVAEPLPEEGLGRVVNDRLRRAAAPRD